MFLDLNYLKVVIVPKIKSGQKNDFLEMFKFW